MAEPDTGEDPVMSEDPEDFWGNESRWEKENGPAWFTQM